MIGSDVWGKISLRERESDDGLSSLAAFSFQFFQEFRFQVIRIDFHLAFSNLLVRRSLKAKLADADSFFRANRWPEGSAGDRARSVEITGPGVGVKSRARLIVGEVLKSLLRFLVLT